MFTDFIEFSTKYTHLILIDRNKVAQAYTSEDILHVSSSLLGQDEYISFVFNNAEEATEVYNKIKYGEKKT